MFFSFLYLKVTSLFFLVGLPLDLILDLVLIFVFYVFCFGCLWSTECGVVEWGGGVVECLLGIWDLSLGRQSGAGLAFGGRFSGWGAGGIGWVVRFLDS